MTIEEYIHKMYLSIKRGQKFNICLVDEDGKSIKENWSVGIVPKINETIQIVDYESEKYDIYKVMDVVHSIDKDFDPKTHKLFIIVKNQNIKGGDNDEE